MRNLTIVFVLLLIMPMSVLAIIPQKPSVNTYVYDYGNAIADDVEEHLIQAAFQLEQATGKEIVMMTIDTIDGQAAYEFGTKVIREWGIGSDELNNGMLIFATTEQGPGKNDVWISVGQGLEGDYPDGKLGRMIDELMMPYLAEGDYSSAFANIFNTFYEEMGGSTTDMPPVQTNDGTGGISIGLIIFIIIIYLIVTNFGGGGPSGRRRTARRVYRSGGFGSGTGGFGGGGSSGGFGGFGGGGSAGGGAGRKF